MNIKVQQRRFLPFPKSSLKRLSQRRWRAALAGFPRSRFWRSPLRGRPIGASPKLATGFTLIETFVAISVLLTAIAGPLTIAAKGLSSAMIARDQITAFYLGQDAVEFIRHRKDTNSLSGNPWLSGLDACLNTLCRVDTKEDEITSCGASCPPLRYSEASGFFTYTLGEETHFTRSVKITPGSESHEAAIEVTVSWVTVGGLVRSFSVKEYIFDWQ